ncbi:DUF4214 domain-containing protein [Pseudomonas sp. NPDC087358]|uniref:DUF4214 domain-containing protein n=1 Tax=Pseudomonas sp. NPDC087358 TaxID=3364439 RepID=UPI00384B871E
MATTSAQVQQLYVAYLGRAADKAGLDYWLNELNGSTTAPATLTLENLRANFVNEQPEYADAYAGLTRSETVSKIYLQLFGHSADAAGLTYWTTGGGASVNTDQLLQAFVNGASASDAKIVANKVLVAEVYTSTAGENYASADAKSIITGVTGDTATVTTALGHLSDGTLSGLAIPAGVAIIKADAVADAAVVSYEASKVDSLTALNDKVVALNADYHATLDDITDTDADDVISYDEASVALTNATELRAEIGGSTAQLQLDASTAATALATARANLVSTHPDAVTEINAYNDAVTAAAAAVAPTEAKIDTDTAALQGVIGTNASAFAAANTAYVAAGGSTIADADALFTAISTADAATLAKIDAAFNTGVFTTNYAGVKADGVAQAAFNAADAKLTAAEGVVGNAYVNAAENSAAAAKIVADAQAADALVAEANAEITAHDAVQAVAADTQTALNGITTGVNAYAHDEAAVANGATVAGTAKADLFFFGTATGTATANDFTITAFNKGDAIYVGEGYTFNSAVTVGTDGYAVGTNTAAKEVYFTQAANGTVSVNIETNAVGHTAGTGATDNVAVITLTGVTSLSDVSYANGVITSAHVA